MVQVNAKVIAEAVPQIEAYMERLKAQVAADYLSWGKNSEYSKAHIPQLDIQYGTKFAKIVVMEQGRARSVFGFIEMATGKVWKAASFKAPALNFPRGHVSDTAEQMKKIRWTGIS